jgi:hypothetical protein
MVFMLTHRIICLEVVMSKLCYACKEKPGLFLAKVFDLKGSGVDILLCRDHDIELYKIGQLKFVAKHNLKIKESEVKEGRDADDVLGDFA